MNLPGDRQDAGALGSEALRTRVDEAETSISNNDPVWLRFISNGPGDLALYWGIGFISNSAPKYMLDERSIQAGANELRAALSAIAEHYEDQAFADHVQPPQSVLDQLAQAGAALYSRIVREENTELRAVLSASPRPIYVQVQNLRFHIPWGAIVTGAVQLAVSGIQADFWAMRHNVVSFPRRFLLADAPQIYPDEDSAVLGCADKKLIERIVGRPSNRLGTKKVCFSAEQFGDAWARTKEANRLLYLFGDSNGGSVQFSEVPQDGLSAKDFEYYARKDQDRHPNTSGLLFLNCCDLAVSGQHLYNWQELSWNGMVRGVIGLEAKVREDVAWQLGSRLAREIATGGEPVLRIVKRFRQDHFPWGLLYGVHCDPQHSFAINETRVLFPRSQPGKRSNAVP